MKRHSMAGLVKLAVFAFPLVILVGLVAAGCVGDVVIEEGQERERLPSPTPVPTSPMVQPSLEMLQDKWALWVDGPHLRGANIWQALVIPDLDGLEFKGDSAVGPPFTQEDFYALSALGANYVSISGPGLFTETPPYKLDPAVQANLDNLLAMIAEADMFATIGFRTGPGRSEYSLCCEGDDEFDGYFNDSLWGDETAQAAWVQMWRYTAERYREDPIVVGYKLMVEPNAPGIVFEVYDPAEFYEGYRGTSYDWNQLYPRIAAGIREVDETTPILIGGAGWSSVEWLPYLDPLAEPRIVYIIHQYAPQEQYTHQEPPLRNTYPGQFDTNDDGRDEQFDRSWLEQKLSPVNEFMAATGAPVAVDEFGVVRWQPGAANFLTDQLSLFEALGLNHAIWEWSTSWPPFAEDVHAMNYRYGPNPEVLQDDLSNELLAAIRQYWALNEVRPSTYIE